MSLESYIAAMPKVELHVHLEGSTQPETLLKIAQRNKIKLPADTVEGLRELYQYRNFDDFIKIYLMIVGAFKTPQDFTDLVYDFGAEMHRQNIRYSEVTWTPQLHVPFNAEIPFTDLLQALNDGRQKAKDDFGVDMCWIPDIARNFPEFKKQTQEWLCSDEALNGGVVAFGLGGAEVGYPPEDFEDVFTIAREQYGLPANPHAGETVGPASVWGAIKSLKAVRIGHGVRAIEDLELVKYLAEHKIPLEVNPTSNLKLQIYPSYDDHPLKKLMDAGCIVSINSDDPPLFNTTLTEEYLHAIQDCGLTLSELEKTVLDALDTSYLPKDTKHQLKIEFSADFARLRTEHGVQDV